MGKTYYRSIFFLYISALFICGACRVYLVLYGTDPRTGFYSMDTPAIPVLNLVFAGAVLLMLLLNRLRVTEHEYPIIRDSRLDCLLALLTGLSLFLFILENTGWARYIIPVTGLPLTGISLWICGILGCLATLSFLWMGIRGFVGITGPPNTLFPLLPPIWQVVLIIAKFNSYTTLTTVPDNLLTVLFMVFSSVFLVGHARTVCEFARKDGRNYTLSTGLATSLTGFLLIVPNFVYMAVNRSGLLAPSLGYMESVYVFFMSLYALAASIRLRRSIALV